MNLSDLFGGGGAAAAAIAWGGSGTSAGVTITSVPTILYNIVVTAASSGYASSCTVKNGTTTVYSLNVNAGLGGGHSAAVHPVGVYLSNGLTVSYSSADHVALSYKVV